jgi:YD repeat-containing protein
MRPHEVSCDNNLDSYRCCHEHEHEYEYDLNGRLERTARTERELRLARCEDAL